jgi:hypothetical protein
MNQHISLSPDGIVIPDESNEASTWASFEAVANERRSAPNWYAGPGFVFSLDDPFCGIDLDDALDTEGSVSPWARGIVERFGDTYMEISPGRVGTEDLDARVLYDHLTRPKGRRWRLQPPAEVESRTACSTAPSCRSREGLHLARAAGPQARVLVDTGHHYASQKHRTDCRMALGRKYARGLPF